MRDKVENGTELHCLTKTLSNGQIDKVYYLYETALFWDYYDKHGKIKPDIVRSREPYDGESIIIYDNGD